MSTKPEQVLAHWDAIRNDKDTGVHDTAGCAGMLAKALRDQLTINSVTLGHIALLRAAVGRAIRWAPQPTAELLTKVLSQTMDLPNEAQ